MKRSEINRCIVEAGEFFTRHGFYLPPFAFWTPGDWKDKGSEANEIRARRLGWDVTDFGSGQYLSCGLTLFTLRNGRPFDTKGTRSFAEKIMLLHEQQVTPWQFHVNKTEDIINRGGGRLVCELFNADPRGGFANTPVTVYCDGLLNRLSPGARLTLEPGQSVTVPPGVYHCFYALKGDGMAMIGEISCLNDDAGDNRFRNPVPRFPAIEEDQPPLRLLCTEYPPPLQ